MQRIRLRLAADRIKWHTSRRGCRQLLAAPESIRDGGLLVSDDTARTERPMAILIVAYRSVDQLANCLQAVRRHLPELPVYIWDNSGPAYDGVRELVGPDPHVSCHTTSANIGFAAAVNKLAALAPGSDLLLLNPDAELVSDLPETRKALQQGEVAAVAPLVLDPEVMSEVPRRFSPASAPWDVAHRRTTFLNAVGMYALRPERFRGTCLSDRYLARPLDVDGYLTGACLAINRRAWDALGDFDEQFFLYGEEANWQERALASGWRIRLANEVGVLHSGHGTVAGDSVASRRSDDLLRAAVALQLEYRYARFAAECYIAIVSLIELAKHRLARRLQRPAGGDIMVTVDEPLDSVQARQSITAARQLADAGYKVVLVSLGRLATLPREIPISIRLIRRPWYWPTTAPDATPRVLIAGTTKKQRAFTRLYRLGRGKVSLPVERALTPGGGLPLPLQSPHSLRTDK